MSNSRVVNSKRGRRKIVRRVSPPAGGYSGFGSTRGSPGASTTGFGGGSSCGDARTQPSATSRLDAISMGRPPKDSVRRWGSQDPRPASSLLPGVSNLHDLGVALADGEIVDLLHDPVVGLEAPHDLDRLGDGAVEVLVDGP